MACTECKLLANQAVIALEEIQKLRDQIAEEFSSGAVSQELVRALEARERSYERCLAAIERHQASHQTSSTIHVPLLV
jgi:hypothetical protein